MTLRRWKSTLRAGLERLRERPRRGAALPPLSVAVIAMDCREDLIDLVEHVRGFASEVVVVDGGSRDGSIEWCRAEPLVKLVERPWDGHFGRQKNAALEACSGEWILHLDCDERVGPRLLDRLPALCTGAADFYRLPMYWLVSTGPDRYVDTPKHYPCHVPRLLRNRPEFRYCEDAPVHVRFPRAVTRSMVKIHGAHLFHYCFVWLSRAELEQVVALAASTIGLPATVAAWTWVQDV